MIAAGIVVEYNPLHNGHRYHIQQTKEKTGADCLIAVMSGNFLQRGEPALVDKFTRTKMALAAGCDIVVELPYAFATQHAEIFARGAVEILSALDCTYLVFGSEDGEISRFLITASLLERYEEKINAALPQVLKEGVSYPRAYEQAFMSVCEEPVPLDFTRPNNMLGLNYVKAIKNVKSPLTPLTIKRAGTEFHDPNLPEKSFASATAIRNTLLANHASLEAVQAYIPPATRSELDMFYREFQTFATWERLWPYLKYELMVRSLDELRIIYEMEEGLEARMKTGAKSATTFQEFMEHLKTKRYTWTRLQRAALHVLTNTKKTDMRVRSEKAGYIRLLGMSKTGRAYLNQKKKNVSLPVISRISRDCQELLALDIKAAQIYAFAFGIPKGQKLIDAEWRQPPLVQS